jgi:hypothetical protein
MNRAARRDSIIDHNLNYPKPCEFCGRWMNNEPAASTHHAQAHDEYDLINVEDYNPDTEQVYRCNRCYNKLESSRPGRCGCCGKNPNSMYGKRKRTGM